MRQYIRLHKEIIVLTIALIFAMFLQYLRISSLDIAFLLETTASTYFIYLLVIIIVPIIVLFFIFVPILFITEITYNISLPKQFKLDISNVVYSIKTTTSNYIRKQKRTTVLRC